MAADAAAGKGRGGVLDALRRLDAEIQRVEVWLCLASLLVMVVLAFVQVFLRQLQGELVQPVPWFDNVTRHLVIWVGMLGASLATAEGRHISIEALPKLLSSRGRRRLEVFVNLVALAITALLLALAVIYMLRVQLPTERHLFIVSSLGDLKVYRWPFLVVVPVGLALICWRFGLRAAECLALSDDEYRDREEALEDEVAGYTEQHEEEQAALLADHERQVAEESGKAPPLEGEAARRQLREAAEEEERRRRELLRGRQPRRLVGRSTEELPIYRELADQEDLRDPEERAEPLPPDVRAELVESDAGVEDFLSSTSDIDVADDFLESMADTQRVPEPSDEDGADVPEDASDEDDVPPTPRPRGDA